jgi:hypothetical protein
MHSYFLSTARWRGGEPVELTHDELVDELQHVDPDYRDVEIPEADYKCTLSVGGRHWSTQTGHIIKVHVDKIMMKPRRGWHLEHAAGILATMREGKEFEVPQGIVHKITAGDVSKSAGYEKKGVLGTEMEMSRPWAKSDVGTYAATLIHGNHATLAAMALGEQYIPVAVQGGNVPLKKDYVKFEWDEWVAAVRKFREANPDTSWMDD